MVVVDFNKNVIASTKNEDFSANLARSFNVATANGLYVFHGHVLIFRYGLFRDHGH